VLNLVPGVVKTDKSAASSSLFLYELRDSEKSHSLADENNSKSRLFHQIKIFLALLLKSLLNLYLSLGPFFIDS